MLSSVVVQKQVGQTIVQLPQVRQRLATSSQRGDSRLSRSSARRSTSGISRPIRSAAASTAALAVGYLVAAARRGVLTLRQHPAALRGADVDHETVPGRRRSAR